MDSDRASAELGSVEHDIVSSRADRTGIAVDGVILLHGHGEGMMHRVISSVLLAVLEQREFVIHRKLNFVLSISPMRRATSHRSAPRESNTTLFFAATMRRRSPSPVPVISVIAFSSSSVRNLAKEDDTASAACLYHASPRAPYVLTYSTSESISLREGCAAGHVDCAHASALGDRILEHGERRIAHGVRYVISSRANLVSGLSGPAVALHSLVPRSYVRTVSHAAYA